MKAIPMYTTVVIVSLLLTIVTLGHCISGSISKLETLRHLHQLNADISNANIYLRNAAMVPQAQIETQLAKMTVTRKSADSIYAALDMAKLTSFERQTVNTMRTERSEYRKAQLELIESIRQDDDKKYIQLLPFYESLMERYTGRVAILITHVNRDIDTYDKLLVRGSILALANAMLFLSLILKNLRQIYVVKGEI